MDNAYPTTMAFLPVPHGTLYTLPRLLFTSVLPALLHSFSFSANKGFVNSGFLRTKCPTR
jgi:hypothetical protein